jgi:vacuolar fusion protein MON1
VSANPLAFYDIHRRKIQLIFYISYIGAVRCLPLPEKARENITSAITSTCHKIRDLVFAILIAGNQLITLVRMKKYTLHPSDIHLLFNLVRSSESFKTAESWTPICLPKFDAT